MTDFQSLLDTPARTLRFEVLDHPSMGVAEKRALLASWASDANVVPGAPSLRQLNDGSLVAIDEILRALKSLDMGDMRIPEHGKRAAFWQAPFERRRGWTSRNWAMIVRRRRSDDDDDPPPCPAYAAIPPKRGGGAACAYPDLALA